MRSWTAYTGSRVKNFIQASGWLKIIGSASIEDGVHKMKWVRKMVATSGWVQGGKNQDVGLRRDQRQAVVNTSLVLSFTYFDCEIRLGCLVFSFFFFTFTFFFSLLSSSCFLFCFGWGGFKLFSIFFYSYFFGTMK